MTARNPGRGADPRAAALTETQHDYPIGEKYRQGSLSRQCCCRRKRHAHPRVRAQDGHVLQRVPRGVAAAERVRPQFRDNGYRCATAATRRRSSPALWPIAFRTTVGYQWRGRRCSRPTRAPPPRRRAPSVHRPRHPLCRKRSRDRGQATHHVHAGLRSAASRCRRATAISSRPGRACTSYLGTTWLNLRVGKHALDLPGRAPLDHLTQGYNEYHFHRRSAATFEPGNNQVAIEVFGHMTCRGCAIRSRSSTPTARRSPKTWCRRPALGHVQDAPLRQRQSCRGQGGGVRRSRR